ncbi:MAG: hypothetical protein ACE5IO_10615, partial [Thermoplasmata archaeon]
GSYDFAIWASDTNGNWNSTAGSFVVENTLPPAAPFVLDAYLTGPKWEDVALTWLLSSDDGMGSEDVVRYDIYRNVTAYDGLGMGYQLHDSVPAGMFTYLDSGAGEGNPEDFFYYVCAVDSANMSACSSGQMGKITHHLLTGPQLISIPLVQKDPSIEKVLQTLIFDYAWAYDNSATTDEWIAFSVSKPYDGSMQTIDRRKAVWVNVTTESNMTVAGVVPKKTIINLTRGWNLVGYPSFHNKAASDALEGVPFERLEGFDQLASPYFLRVLDDSSVFAACHGYWILVQTDSSWTLVN